MPATATHTMEEHEQNQISDIINETDTHIDNAQSELKCFAEFDKVTLSEDQYVALRHVRRKARDLLATIDYWLID